MRQVFISSTVNDLKAYREAARDACLELGLTPVMMQDFPAMSAGATAGSLKMLAGCDLYVGIFAHRYGYCEDGHDGKSVTEIEFDTATRDSIDRLCFVVRPDFDWPEDLKEKDKEAELRAFKDKVQKLVVRFFTTPDDFKSSLILSLHQWLNEHPASGGLDATLAADPDGIPERPRKLIGRDEMVKEGLEVLTGDQPLLLHGFAGMGKTALAAEVAAQWIEQNKRPALWLKIGALAFDACAAALARPFGAQAADAAALRNVLKASGVGLVVLDDAWNGAGLDELVKAMPRDMAVMVTSRRRYPVGEMIEVGRLAEGDALALLGYHLGAGAGQDARAGELVKLLGNHAFSIEVAGRTMKARRWTPAEMIANIEGAPDRLEMPADYGPEERRSVKRLLDASFEALPGEMAKKVFLAFGALFSPQATPEMLGLLAGIETKEAASALVELDDHGLTERVPAERNKSVEYYRIHDLAASYARAQATDDQRAAAVDACLAYLSRYQEPGHASFAALRPELDNLLGAAGRALELGRPADCEEFAWGMYFDQILDRQGYYRQGAILLSQAIDAARQRGDRAAESAHLNHLGLACASSGQIEKATGFFDQALTIARGTGDRRGEGAILDNLGNVYYSLGNIEKAMSSFERVLAICRETGDRRGEGTALCNLGNTYFSLEKVEKAAGCYERSLAIAREVGDRRGEGNAVGSLGLVYFSVGQVEKAIGYYEQQLAIAREVGDRRGEGNALGNLGSAYYGTKQFEKASSYYQQQILIAREIGDGMGEGNALWGLAMIDKRHGDLNACLEHYRQAQAIFAEIGAQHLVRQVDENIANIKGKLKGG